MKILSPFQTSSVNNSSNIKNRKKIKNSTDFDDMLDDISISDTHETYTGNMVNIVGSLLILQEAPDTMQERKKKAKKNAKLMINIMEDIRAEILNENISIDNLEKLEQLIKIERQNIDDNKLNDILEDIEIRAAVELAKLKK